MNLSDFMGGPNGASTINIGSDTTLSMGNGSTQILVPSGAYTVTPPTDLGDSGMLLLYNDSEYNLKIMIDDPDYFTLVAGKVCRLFYGNSKWYVVTSDIKKPFHDIDGNNLTTSKTVFSTTAVSYCSLVYLGNSKCVVCFRDEVNNNYGTAIVGVIDGTSITFGTKYVFKYANSTEISVAKLTDSKIVVAYEDRDNSGLGKAIIGDISETTINFGSEYTFYSDWTWEISVNRLTDTKFSIIFQYYTNANRIGGIVGEVSGNSIAFGSISALSYTGNYTPHVDSVALNESKIVYCFFYSSKGYAQIANITGNSITLGSGIIEDFDSGTIDSISVAKLTDDKFVVCYCLSSSYGRYNIGTVSGDTITCTTPGFINNQSIRYTTTISLSDTDWVCCYSNFSFGEMYIKFGSNYRTNYLFNGMEDALYNSGDTISPYKFLTAYRDEGNSSYGTVALTWG